MTKRNDGLKPGWQRQALRWFAGVWIVAAVASAALFMFVASLVPSAKPAFTVAFVAIVFVMWPLATAVWFLLFPRFMRLLNNGQTPP